MTRLGSVFLAALLVGAPALAQDTVLRCGAIFDGDAMGGAGTSSSGTAGSFQVPRVRMRSQSTSPGTPAFPG